MQKQHDTLRRLVTTSGLVVGALLMGLPAVLALQQPPPIQGVTGTIATEGTIQETDAAGHSVLVKAADGVQHLFHLSKRSRVHSGEGDLAADEALRGLKKGTPVVVHYTSEGETLTAEEIDRIGAEGLRQIEGSVTKVDRITRTISIKLADGTTQTLRLSERAAADAGKDLDSARDGARIIVYYKDEAGQRVAHYFKRVS